MGDHGLQIQMSKRFIIQTTQKRFASQEINPILIRLNYNNKFSPLPLDRNPSRTWTNVFFAPHKGSPMWNTYAPFTIQHLRMKKYLDGYFEDQAIISTPHIYRTIAGNLVRLYVYNPKGNQFDWKSLEDVLSKIFGEYQGPGTSGRSIQDNKTTGRVKVKLDIVELPSPMLNAEILSQFVGRQLAQYINPASIFDKLVSAVDDSIPKVAEKMGASGLSIAGFRLRIKGRPKGEEMAVKHDFLHGSCPKTDHSALIDYGKHSILLRSGLVGVKAWVHFQRPHREDETGQVEILHNLSQEGSDPNAGKKTDFPSLLSMDRDYDPISVPTYSKRNEGGLWNVVSSSDREIEQMVTLLKSLHEPDHPDMSRFIW